MSGAAYSAPACQLTNHRLKRAEISICLCPFLWKVNKFGRRSNGPMSARCSLRLTLADWPEFVVPPPQHASGSVPSHTRWRRPAERRPYVGFAEVDSLSHSPFGRKALRVQRTGAGRGQGTCIAGPRACAQPAPPPPGPGPVRSGSPLGLTHCLAVVRHHRACKAASALQPGLTSILEMFGLFPPKQPAFKTKTAGPAPGPRSLHGDATSL